MKKIVKHLALLSLVISAVACNKKETPAETPAEVAPATEEVQAPTADAFTVELESNDQMQFNQTEIKVPVGKTISLTLKHTGKMAKEVMGHNFVLLNKGVDMAAFATKAAEAKDNGFVPAGSEADVLAKTDLIGGGESTTVEFTITEAGKYDFLCSFPGHYAMMKGVIIAE
ncbi:azurin [Myroides sp. JBRI-B21084]|uniref:azurin n=1 Tax=Myroides sp. JBRI-B21084 TaxID=3119977 RepID=UPI0026E27744|nr:azurin [Paenimyroides cloacae]WKW46517.1 azurin [Paenimyroides cloacae]